MQTLDEGLNQILPELPLIAWTLGPIEQEHGSGFAEFVVNGVDQKGNKYIGSIETFISDPVLDELEIYDIEKQ